MPYTLSHTIISLPVARIVRGKIPVAALIVGSVSPDLPYLIALTPTEAPGHSVYGVLVYCLPPSLLLLFIWYRWVERPTLELFNLPLRSWLFNTARHVLMIAGILIGAYSHVLWDSTSHLDGAFVVGSKFWNTELYSLPLYKWNQYGSGVLGVMLLSLWYLYVMRHNQQRNYQGRLAIGLTVYFVCIMFFLVLANVVHGSSSLSQYLARSATGLITGGMVSMCVYAVVIHRQTHNDSAPQ